MGFVDDASGDRLLLLCGHLLLDWRFFLCICGNRAQNIELDSEVRSLWTIGDGYDGGSQSSKDMAHLLYWHIDLEVRCSIHG